MNITKASELVLDQNQHIAKKMRALFYLRNILTEESVSILCNAFTSKSVLFKHEVAYVLGQMRLDSSIDTLIRVLDDPEEDEIVRHEAAEALGNFSSQEKIVDSLKKNLYCGSIPVQETCYLALKKIQEKKDVISKFNSRDPAIYESLCFSQAKKMFLDREECLYKRYQAMFYLRDNGSSEAIEILGKGMSDHSSLFKHEIAFVFGQMANPLSIDYLVKGMKDEGEHGMVRHECAEALGIIGSDKCLKELVKYQYSDCDILRESVEVAIDLHGYVNSNEQDYCVVKE